MKKFLFLVPVLLVLALGTLFVSLRRQEISCGCGLPTAQETGEYQENAPIAIFNNQSVASKMAEIIPSFVPVLGETSDERWIEIDLSEQRLYAHNGNNIDYEMLISGGKWAPTPTGEFRIWIKLRYTLMHGGDKAKHTYYYLPNVPFTQYFYKGYGLHGAYWHNNFGQPMSHGCVNLATPDAEKLFYWTSPPVVEGKGTVYPTKDNPGTRVVIHV